MVLIDTLCPKCHDTRRTMRPAKRHAFLVECDCGTWFVVRVRLHVETDCAVVPFPQATQVAAKGAGQ
jgi:hypothetical protein